METQQTEYKTLWKDDYLKWICGFANALGGVLSVGVDDDGRVVGVENAKKILEDIPNKIAATMGLIVDVNLKEENKKEYLTILVPVSSVPVAYHGKYYYRSGATLQELSGIALQDFLMKKMGLTWEAQAVETLLKKHESKRRNELIAQTFYYAGFIEAWGRGFEKIRESFGEENLKMPSFEENGRFFSVEILREKYASLTGENHESDTDVVDNVTMNVVDELTERQKDIIKYIQHYDIDDVTMIVTMNATTMAQHFHVSRRTIMRDIDFLVSKGLIKRVGSKMKGHWEVIYKQNS